MGGSLTAAEAKMLSKGSMCFLVVSQQAGSLGQSVQFGYSPHSQLHIYPPCQSAFCCFSKVPRRVSLWRKQAYCSGHSVHFRPDEGLPVHNITAARMAEEKRPHLNAETRGTFRTVRLACSLLQIRDPWAAPCFLRVWCPRWPRP